MKRGGREILDRLVNFPVKGHKEMRKTFFLLGLGLFLCACTPAISKDSLRMADPTLTFQALIKDPESYRGKNILTGGEILAASASGRLAPCA